jgi:NAD(P)-dependent dehydrogenase (short-subunit alcohol dehydrogenase family)
MKTAIVTGASYGIGAAIAQTLLRHGWKVYGLSRSQPESHEHLVWLQCDLTKPDEINTCLHRVKEPVIDALVSNAGVVYEEPASAVTTEVFQKTFAVNVLAPMLLVRGLRDKLTHATIVSVSSVSDRLPDPAIALYCSSKAANTSFFNSLALELTDARVYSLLPDYVDTPMLRSSPPAEDSFNWKVTIQPDDISKLTMDLISGTKLPSGANIIVVTDALKDSLRSREQLYGYNTDTGELRELQGQAR